MEREHQVDRMRQTEGKHGKREGKGEREKEREIKKQEARTKK